MQTNPYSDDPINTQPTEANPVPPARQQPVPPPSYNPNAPNAPQYPYPQNEIRSDQRRAVRNEERANTAAYGVAKAMDYLRWLLVVVEVILLLRFLLKLIGADPYNPFANFLYNLSGVFDAPFVGIVRDPNFGTYTAHVFEWTTLIAMAVYAVLFWIIWLLLRTTISRPQEPIS
jgi:YggT family protein